MQIQLAKLKMEFKIVTHMNNVKGILPLWSTATNEYLLSYTPVAVVTIQLDLL